MPAVPVDVAGILDTLVKLGLRANQCEQAYQGLSKTFTIDATTARAHSFLFGAEAADAKRPAGLRERQSVDDPSRRSGRKAQRAVARVASGGDGLTSLALDDPEQWSMSWTRRPPRRLPHLKEWAATVDVTLPDRATEAFFPNIAGEGLPSTYCCSRGCAAPMWGHGDGFGSAWTAELDGAADACLPYVIDLRIYETLQPQPVAGPPRFAPSSVVVLVQDAATKALTPELIRVAGGDNQPKVFSRESAIPSAEVYALQAAKVSLTVYGIWIGHVYHWHIVVQQQHVVERDDVARVRLEVWAFGSALRRDDPRDLDALLVYDRRPP